MKVTTLTVKGSPYEPEFEGITPAVEQLFVRSDNFQDLLARPRVAIVGSRKISAYGKAVTAQFAGQLAKQGIVIVSGLAYGVDSIAHRAALEAGGALLSEYPEGTPPYPVNFIERNRIVSGMSSVLLITEAADKSGTMHTARFALEQGKEVLAVPGNITSPTSVGTNNLIKTGAITVTSPEDVLGVLGFKRNTQAPRVKGSNGIEQCILDLLTDNISDGNELLSHSRLSSSEFNQALTMMEITGKVKALGANQWTIS
jgi:DNA processing protein